MDSEKPKSNADKPASILVVEDTPANLQVLAGMLRDRGYKVRPVPSGKLALLAARRDPADLILLDIMMPEMNGYEVCEHLKADDTLKKIPVIFVSALAEQLDKAKAFAIAHLRFFDCKWRRSNSRIKIRNENKKPDWFAFMEYRSILSSKGRLFRNRYCWTIGRSLSDD